MYFSIVCVYVRSKSWIGGCGGTDATAGDKLTAAAIPVDVYREDW